MLKFITKRFNIFGSFGLLGTELVSHITICIHAVTQWKNTCNGPDSNRFLGCFLWDPDEIFMPGSLKVDKRPNYPNLNLISGSRCTRPIMGHSNNSPLC